MGPGGPDRKTGEAERPPESRGTPARRRAWLAAVALAVACAPAPGARADVGRRGSPDEFLPSHLPSLPGDPQEWVRRAARRSGLDVRQLSARADSTLFPLPSGRTVRLWEVKLDLVAEARIDDLGSFLRALRTGPARIHVPDMAVTWSGTNRVRIRMHASLLGTWPGRSRPGTKTQARPPGDRS
jgi:hypothetical protein